jgi:hypothetical protein
MVPPGSGVRDRLRVHRALDTQTMKTTYHATETAGGSLLLESMTYYARRRKARRLALQLDLPVWFAFLILLALSTYCILS